MGLVHSVDKGFFPLDEELGLLPGVLTPQGHESLVRLCAWMPFEKAAGLFADMMEIEVSQALGQRYGERAGAAYVQLQTQAVECIEQEAPAPPEPSSQKLQLSADGAMVPLLHGQWGEVRTLVIGDVQPAVREGEEWVVHTHNLSYFSRKVSARDFERLALVELHTRGVTQAQAVGAVMDGAEWEQGFLDYHCPQAVRILDFPHAAEHITPIGAFLYGEGTPEGRQWLQERLHDLKHAGPTALLEEVRTLQKQHPQAEVVASNLAYLEKREDQLQYPAFQAQGWPIGSGIVESGNKVVVEARLKGSGMHWAEAHVNPMLALRNIICSNRWKQEWPKIEQALRQQDRERRIRLHRSHQTPSANGPTPPSPPALPTGQPHSFPSTLDYQRLAHASQANSSSWKYFRFGRARFQRPDPPKN